MQANLLVEYQSIIKDDNGQKYIEYNDIYSFANREIEQFKQTCYNNNILSILFDEINTDYKKYVNTNTNGEIIINQMSHGFSTMNSYPFAAFINGIGGLEQASALNISGESFGICEVIDMNTLRFRSKKGVLVKSMNHGFTIGNFLYLQDDGTVAETVGTNYQKIYKVIDDSYLLFLGERMYQGNYSIIGNSTKITIINVLDNNNVNQNTGTKVLFDTQPVFSNIDNLTVNSDNIILPEGIYEIDVILGLNTTSSTRSNVNCDLYEDNVRTHTRYGSNYARMSSGHNQTGGNFKFSINLSQSTTCDFRTRREANSANVNIVGQSLGQQISQITIKKYQ